jgi:transposase InsO family protein
MTRMGIEAVYRKPHTSQRHPAHKVYPYLLRQLEITRPNHVWAADITYIPMQRGFVYLFAVLDWASRRVLAWWLFNTLTTDCCIETVQEAVTNYGAQTIFNTDLRVPVHKPGVHGDSQRARHSNQHGRHRLLARQRVCGTTLEEHQIREGLSARLRDRRRSATGIGTLPDVLQPAATT